MFLYFLILTHCGLKCDNKSLLRVLVLYKFDIPFQSQLLFHILGHPIDPIDSQDDIIHIKLSLKKSGGDPNFFL